MRQRAAGVLLLSLLALTTSALAQKTHPELDAHGLPVQMAFFDAIERGRVAAVDAMLARGFSVNEVQDYGFEAGDSPLMKAAGRGNAPLVDFLLRRGARVNYRNPNDHESALFRAVKMADSQEVTGPDTLDYPRTLALLLRAGANPDLPDRNGQLPLYFARQAWTLKALLDGGAHPNAPTPRPPLLEHASDAERLKLLLEAGADPNVRDAWGHSALHIAAGQGSLAPVQALLTAMRPAAIHAPDKEGRTALHAAAQGGQAEVVGLLLAQGLPATPQAWQEAIGRGHLQAARLLRQALGEPAWPVVGPQSPIDLRIYTLILQERPVQALAAYRAFEREACGRKTPLATAIDARNIEAVRELLALGVDVNYQTPAPVRSFQSAAHPLSSSGLPRTVHELPPPCGAAAWVNSTTTPLMDAIQRDDIAIARLLLTAGADPDLKSHYPPHLSARTWWERPGVGEPSAAWRQLLGIRTKSPRR